MTQDEIIADFKRRYEGTYVMVEFPDSAKEELFHVDAVSSHGDMYQISMTSNNYGQLVINYGSKHKIKFKTPPVGAFQCGKVAYLYTRIPSKQYQRGLSNGNAFITTSFWKIYHNRNAQWNSVLVQAAFDAKTYPLQEALTMLIKEKYISVALRNNYTISQYNEVSGPFIVYYMDTPVGTCDASGRAVSIFEKSISLEEVLRTL